MKKRSILLSLLTAASAYSYSIMTPIGKVRMEGSSGGLSYVTKEDGNIFPNCSTDSNTMYMTVSYSAEQKKSFLSFFLTAKSTGSAVLIWYTVDGDGYCRMTDAELGS